MKNSHTRSEPGSASGSTRALASPTAIRRSSMSSRVKSRRAASPAEVVRSTDTYALSAGSRSSTSARDWSPGPVGDMLVSPSNGVVVGA